MLRSAVVALFLASLVSAIAAQTPADGAQAKLEALLKRRDLPIRDFLADPKVQYAWKDGQLTHRSAHLHATGVFRVDSVKVKQSNGFLDQVTLSGQRRIALWDATGKIGLAPSSESMSLQIDLKGLGPATLEQLAAALFFPSTDEMVAGVPEQFTGFAPGRPSGVRAPDNPTDKSMKWIDQAGTWKHVDQKADGFLLPKISFQPVPEFSEEARRVKVSGNVLIGIEVDEHGKVSQFWLARPLGLGLDEKALAAVSQYRFEPCMWKGHPVGMAMAVEVNFQIF